MAQWSFVTSGGNCSMFCSTVRAQS
jgi:hypothetical protein